MQRLAVSTGKTDPRLQHRWPAAGRDLWRIFQSLGRAPSMSGISPISQQEIAAWQSNHGVRLTPWELDMLSEWDQLVISGAHQKDPKPS